jgi:hypothetical protein
MAAVVSSSINYVDKLREIAKNARSSTDPKDIVEDWREKKKEADILKFFESEVTIDATKKINERAEKGCFSANILEYHFSEYFYINKKNEVVRVPEFKQMPGYYLHRIHFAVKSDFFQEKLQTFIKEFGGDMQFDCWYPGREKINVITLFWGPTKTHKWELVWGPSDTKSEQSEDLSNADELIKNIDEILASEEKTEEEPKEESYANKVSPAPQKKNKDKK